MLRFALHGHGCWCSLRQYAEVLIQRVSSTRHLLLAIGAKILNGRSAIQCSFSTGAL
jgi:hypothetical protein